MKRARTGLTLIELLVVVGVVALLVAVRMPALCRSKAPVSLIQCLNNCRQMGAVTLLYRSDYADTFPYGHRVYYGSSVTDPTGWPMQLLRYMGGSTNQAPRVYLCPAEKGFAEGWTFQLHYQANRMIINDVDDSDSPHRGTEWRNPAIYCLFMEKGPLDYANVRPGGLTVALQAWNVAPGYPQYRRHSGGMASAAMDGHAEWLRTPPYQLNQPAPDNFRELGDCANGQNPASSWMNNYPYIKLYCRYAQGGGF